MSKNKDDSRFLIVSGTVLATILFLVFATIQIRGCVERTAEIKANQDQKRKVDRTFHFRFGKSK